MLVNIAILIFGLIIGSFLNVLIWRLPRGESIVYPASHCTKCKARICWYDNIPLLSYLLLGGKCRHCRAPIPLRYFVVEALAGILFFLVSLPEGAVYGNALYFNLFFISGLLVAAFADWESGLIPDEIIYLGIPVSLIYQALNGKIVEATLGCVLGFALLLMVQKLGEWIYKKEALGGGDIKLAAFFGAYLTAPYLLLALLLGYLIGAAEALILLALKKKKMGDYIPFGPALCAGALIALFFGRFILDLYLKSLAL